jgi:hypothetical protein
MRNTSTLAMTTIFERIPLVRERAAGLREVSSGSEVNSSDRGCPWFAPCLAPPPPPYWSPYRLPCSSLNVHPPLPTVCPALARAPPMTLAHLTLPAPPLFRASSRPLPTHVYARANHCTRAGATPLGIFVNAHVSCLTTVLHPRYGSVSTLHERSMTSMVFPMRCCTRWIDASFSLSSSILANTCRSWRSRSWTASSSSAALALRSSHALYLW